MSTVLVTGGAGFIGSHVAAALRHRGDEVVVLDSFVDSTADLAEERLVHVLPNLPSACLIRGDICDQQLLDEVFRQGNFEQVVHLAALTTAAASFTNPQQHVAVNVRGTVTVLEAAARHQVQHVVFSSSAAVYGEGSPVALCETDDATHPLSPYGATKSAGEIMCATWQTVHQLPVTVLRFFNVYGPWGHPETALFQFAEAIRSGTVLVMRGQETTRDFLYVDDCVAGIIAALDHQTGATYNLAGGVSVSLPQLIATLTAVLGRPARIREAKLLPGEIEHSLADVRRAQAQLGWQPNVSLEEGIERFAQWYTSWYVPWQKTLSIPRPWATAER